LKVYFLGTGTSQGIPVIGSNHPYAKALILRTKDFEFLGYMGRLLIRNRLRLISGNKCLRLIVKSRWDSFTHEHADHTSGIDDIRPFNFKQGEIPIYAHDRVINNLKNVLIIFSQR
jgi:phosphoribosyl 1,2-cyclic phosphate phosphodiesterase